MSESHNFGTPADDPAVEEPTTGETAVNTPTGNGAAAKEPDGADASGDRSAEEIRAEIAQTREALGETVEALAEKTDVKARAQDQIQTVRQNVAETVAGARGTISEKADTLRSRAQEATPDSAQAGVAQVGATVQEKPLPFATAGAFAAGVAIGWILGRR